MRERLEEDRLRLLVGIRTGLIVVLPFWCLVFWIWRRM